MAIGRFAPSPTGQLHIGNLRTALVAWLFSRSSGSTHLLRFEDLDAALVRGEHYETQARDLLAIGLDWDGDPVRQRDRTDLYLDAIAEFDRRGLTYECFCSRKDIREATQAPNGPQALSSYPGTCRELTRVQRRKKQEAGRPPAIRVRAEAVSIGFSDLICGQHEGRVDDFVIRRNDQTPAYNLAVVVDDSLQGVEQVVRGDDLLTSTVRQLFVAQALDLASPTFVHVPLVMAPTGKRLAKRDGAVTLSDRLAVGETAQDVLGMLGASIGFGSPTLEGMLDEFSALALPKVPYTLSENYLAP